MKPTTVTSRPSRQITKINSGFAQMFQKPNKAEMVLLRNLILEAEKSKKEESIDEDDELASTYEKISRKNIVQLIANNFTNPTNTETIPCYLNLVRTFLNSNPSNPTPTHLILPPSFYQTLRSLNFPHATTLLTQHLPTPSHFSNLHHIFLTATEKFPDDSGHIFLIIVSPRAKTIDYLNSHIENTLTMSKHHLSLVLKFLDFYFSSLVAKCRGRGAGKRMDEGEWWEEWKVRTGKCPLQTEGSNDCGIWVCSVALGVALGYGVMEKEKEWHIRSRRLRMAVELMRGDASSWGYEVLEEKGGSDVRDGWRCVDEMMF